MKYFFYVFLLTQTLLSNTDFSTQEQSVFEENPSSNAQSTDTVQSNREDILNQPIQSVEENIQENIPDVNSQEESPTEESTEQIVEENKQDNTQDTFLPAQSQTIQPVQTSLENTEITQEESSLQEGIQTEQSLFDINAYQTQEPEINYFEEVLMQSVSTQKNIYVSYLDFPSNIYHNQRFEVSIKALVTTEDFDKIETRFINSENMTVLNSSQEWEILNNNTFENRYYFKAYDSNFVMPTFQVILYKDNEVIEVAYLKPKEVNYSVLGQDDEKFSSVIAKNLKVNAFKSKQYNNSELIAILDIEAFESNLEDFHLKNIEEQGFSNINDEYPRQQMLYYVVLPIHHKKIEFNYYNIQSKRFMKVTIPIILENELVSTQTDLNPNNSNLLLYKKVALGVLSFVLLILFVWKRKYVYAAAFFITAGILVYYMLPNRQGYVKANSTIYILPTKNSTIFYSTAKARIVEVVMQKENFVKIMMTKDNKKIIGWIKEEDLVKN